MSDLKRKRQDVDETDSSKDVWVVHCSKTRERIDWNDYGSRIFISTTSAGPMEALTDFFRKTDSPSDLLDELALEYVIFPLLLNISVDEYSKGYQKNEYSPRIRWTHDQRNILIRDNVERVSNFVFDLSEKLGDDAYRIMKFNAVLFIKKMNFNQSYKLIEGSVHQT